MEAGLERVSKKRRWQRILARLESDVTVRISVLADEFGLTTETIRRDIDAMSERGLVNRTYGGAASRALAGEPDLLQREARYVAERERIARRAIGLIAPGDVLMIDSGSTTFAFARALALRPVPLTILTNCLPIAQILGGTDEFAVLLCPGRFSATENAVYGEETNAYLGRFQANKAIIGAGGLSETGVTDADAEACWIKRKMIERAERTLLLLDRSKFDGCLFDTVCPLAAIGDLVVDRAPEGALAGAIDAAGIALHVAGGGGGSGGGGRGGSGIGGERGR